MTSNLSHYMQKALSVILDRPDRRNLTPDIFKPSGFSPRLSHDRDNWILYYGGAFNPPHVGHLAVLSCALTDHGTGLNIVAAMIDPKDDSYLMAKNAESNETFAVTKTDRASLLRSAEGFPDSAWVFEGSECYKPPFMEELKAKAQMAGFVIKFLQVHGPDIVRPPAPPSRGTSNCDSLLIVAGSRETESLSAGYRAEFRGYSSWMKVEYVRAADDVGLSMMLLIKVVDHAQHMLRQLMRHTPRRGTRDLPTWYCDSKSEPGWKAYFVLDTSTAGDAISSTKIRDTLKGESGHGVIDGLVTMVLSPELLLGLLRGGMVRQSRRALHVG